MDAPNTPDPSRTDSTPPTDETERSPDSAAGPRLGIRGETEPENDDIIPSRLSTTLQGPTTADVDAGVPTEEEDGGIVRE